MMKFPIINRLFPSYKWKVAAVIIGGVIVGGGALFMYMLRAHTYLGDAPAACVNCHIMTPYYAMPGMPLAMIVMCRMKML